MKKEELEKRYLHKMVRIGHLEGEKGNGYDNRMGVVEYIDDIGQLHGTWGGLAIIPNVDSFSVVANKIVDELAWFADRLKNQKQRDFYLTMLHHVKVVDAIASVYDVFNTNQLSFISCTINPQPKMCYKNASLLCNLNMEGDVLGGTNIERIDYVEGKFTVLGGFSTDHAFNKVVFKDGKVCYIDVTMELGLHKNIDEIRKEDYVSLYECRFKELCEIEMESGVYGNVFPTLYLNGRIGYDK